MTRQERSRKPTEVEVIHDRREHCIRVSMTYGDGERAYTVKLKPSITRYDFEVVEVTRTTGPQVTDEQYVVGAHAKRELMAWFLKDLSLEISYVKLPFMERLEIAFAITTKKYQDENPSRSLLDLQSLTAEDLHVLAKLAKTINNGIRDTKIEKRSAGYEPSAQYFQELKRETLTDSKVPQHKRDFYSSVLTRCYGWKEGRVPEDVYKEGVQFLQLLKLAWAATSTT